MAQNGAGAVIVNMGAANGADNTTPTSNPKDKKMQDSLFGPSVGVVSSGPAWANVVEKKVLTDELTPEVIRNWVEKSKEPSHPTTTLQALVNLKRPTLRLSPLASVQEDATDEHHHHHGLEFEYDCDAPKCGIYVHVYLPKDHPDAPPTSYSSALSKLLVFETVVDGGFGKILRLEEGATLELGRFEHGSPLHAERTVGNLGPIAEAASGAGEVASGETSSAIPATQSNVVADHDAASNPASRNSRRRFTHFHFRKQRPQGQGRSVSGPALAVVDADPTPAGENKAKDGKEEDADGIRVTIRLAALDEQGAELASPNEQVTYLHVVRFGTKATPPITPPSEGSNEVVLEDNRPWVVKVVKREATIGPHTFHLHEIFGLTSSAPNGTPVPTAPLPPSQPAASHTYPPSSPTTTPQQPTEDEPSSECLLCLSSPREVVLLPCRHLVACKECALNMVEFGAGGNITQPEEPVPAPAAEMPDTNAEAGTTNEAAPAPVVTTPVAPTTTRRKRRAKGWFCPVCRQPYSSLLRITTNPPPMPEEVENKEETTAIGGDGNASEAAPALGTNAADSAAPLGGEGRTGGLLNGNFAPAFLRNLSFSRNPPADVENQAVGVARVAT